jgi:hypothetical protein
VRAVSINTMASVLFFALCVSVCDLFGESCINQHDGECSLFCFVRVSFPRSQKKRTLKARKYDASTLSCA